MESRVLTNDWLLEVALPSNRKARPCGGRGLAVQLLGKHWQLRRRALGRVGGEPWRWWRRQRQQCGPGSCRRVRVATRDHGVRNRSFPPCLSTKFLPDRLLGPSPSLQTLVFYQIRAFGSSLCTVCARDPAPVRHAWPSPLYS